MEDEPEPQEEPEPEPESGLADAVADAGVREAEEALVAAEASFDAGDEGAEEALDVAKAELELRRTVRQEMAANQYTPFKIEVGKGDNEVRMPLCTLAISSNVATAVTKWRGTR